jgi:acyl dehydratase
LVVGEEYVSPGRTVTEADLVIYTGLSGDYNQLHTDEQCCKSISLYKKRVVHGLFALTLVEGLKSGGTAKTTALSWAPAWRGPSW